MTDGPGAWSACDPKRSRGVSPSGLWAHASISGGLRPKARRRRVDRVATKAESMRDDSCAAAWNLARRFARRGWDAARPVVARRADRNRETSLVGSGFRGRPRAETAAALPRPRGPVHSAAARRGFGGVRIRRRGSRSQARADADVRWRLPVRADGTRNVGRSLTSILGMLSGPSSSSPQHPTRCQWSQELWFLATAIPPAAPRSRDLRRARLLGRIRTAPAAGNGGRRR
jgi:hypothetical protein